MKTFTKGVFCTLETLKTARQKPGTVITVTDLFYSVPVRKTFASTETEFDMVQGLVESVALVHSGVSFVLVNSETHCRILETCGKGSTTVIFDRLFGGSAAFGLKPFEFETRSVKFSGHIGTKAASRKSFQFIYVNGRWLPNSVLHKVLHKMLKLSVFLSADQSHRDICNCSTDSHGVYIINISCVMSWTDVSLLKSSSFLEFGNFQDLVDHLKRGVLEFLSRENLLDSLSTACLLRNEPREERAGLQNKGEEMGKHQGSKGTARVGYEDDKHSISTVNIKNNQQSKLVHRFGWVVRKNARNNSEKTLADMSSSNECHMNKLCTLVTRNDSAQLAVDSALTGKSFSQMQEKDCLGYNSQFYSKSVEHLAMDEYSMCGCGKISPDQYGAQLQLQREERQDLPNEYDGFKKHEALRKVLGYSMTTGSNESSAGIICQGQKRLFPFGDHVADDNCRFEDSTGLLKESINGNATKRMNLDYAKITNKSDMSVSCGSYLSDNRVPLEAKSYSAGDGFRYRNHIKDWMSSQMPIPCQDKTLISGAKENLTASVDRCMVDTSETKVEGLLGMQLSSCVIIERTSVSYYYSQSNSLRVRNTVSPGGRMEACKENNFTGIRAIKSSAAERLEQRQQLCLRKHSDLQLDSLNVGHHVCFHDWKQSGKTLTVSMSFDQHKQFQGWFYLKQARKIMLSPGS